MNEFMEIIVAIGLISVIALVSFFAFYVRQQKIRLEKEDSQQKIKKNPHYYLIIIDKRESIAKVNENKNKLKVDAENNLFFELVKPETLFGRNIDNDLVIDEIYVSRVHFSIKIFEENAIINDYSINGTFVNDKRCEKDQALKPGDIILVGYTSMRFSTSNHEKTKQPIETVS